MSGGRLTDEGTLLSAEVTAVCVAQSKHMHTHAHSRAVQSTDSAHKLNLLLWILLSFDAFGDSRPIVAATRIYIYKGGGGSRDVACCKST